MLLPVAYLLLRTADAGWETVWRLVWRERTARVLLNTLALAAAVSGASVVLGVPLAWLTTRPDLPGRRFWAVVSVLPLSIPSLVGAFTFVSAWAQGGLVHQLLRQAAGVARMPDLYGFPGAWLVLTLLSYPYVVLPVRGALLGMDPGQEEAARSLGHGTWSVLWRVTLPQLRPAIASGALLVALYTLSDFSAVALLQFESFTQAIYVQYQATFNRSYAAVLSLLLVVLTVIILGLEALVRGRGRYYRLSAGAARRPTVIPLGPWRWPAVVFCALVGFVAVVVPTGVNVYWVVRGLVTGVGVPLDWQALLRSVYASLLAAGAAVLCALPVAIMSVRWPGRLSSLIERGSYVGYALPGIVVALSLVFFGANYARPLYQTLALLVFAYVVLFLPQALGAVRASLLLVSPHVENAARRLGLPPWQQGSTVPRTHD